jgi:hypothetical protein
VRNRYILCFAIIGLLFISGLWGYVGNGVLSEAQNGKIRMLPNVSGPVTTGLASNSDYDVPRAQGKELTRVRN